MIDLSVLCKKDTLRYVIVLACKFVQEALLSEAGRRQSARDATYARVLKPGANSVPLFSG